MNVGEQLTVSAIGIDSELIGKQKENNLQTAGLISSRHTRCGSLGQGVGSQPSSQT